jgi:hypothetical protein
MTAVDVGSLNPVPALSHPAAGKRVPGRNRSILDVLLGMAQFGSVLDAGVLMVLMTTHGYAIPPAQEERS